MITDTFEAFAHSLRILLESVWRSTELILVDPHEAAGNIEQGLNQALNAFHSVYDVARTIKEIDFDWYATPQTATILAIRNARHHNIAKRIRGLYTYHLQQEHPENPRPYLLIDYPETEDGGDTFDVPISWFDLNNMLCMPQEENKLRKSAVRTISEYLSQDKLNEYHEILNISPSSIFINVTPLIVNACKKFTPVIRPYVKPRSLESRQFLTMFDDVFEADTHKHIVNKINIFLSP
ncbi:hypothetical protein JK205_14370 [Gluconobacter cerinus]|uniref:hypothetical protein n=1 Tax=Gluconobacter cerinus TaxID=38307 RepID=UPI001B8C9A69|nr:hypothetical protein [Gluconobacter cerinus]MBS1020103.1 hypothetical protein [Gluconobacter cerinus]